MNKVVSTYTYWSIRGLNMISMDKAHLCVIKYEQKDTSVAIPQWSEEADHTCKVFLMAEELCN